jgi:hypothetical protein
MHIQTTKLESFMPLRSACALLAGLVLLSGCATPPQTPVALASDFAPAKAGKVGVVLSELPKPDTFFPGAGCLLCMATASAMNSSLTSHARTLNSDELKALKDELGKLLSAKGLDVVVLDEPLKIDALPDRSGAAPNQARKDFTGLRNKYRIDRLLVVHVAALGFTRRYSAYIPTGDAQASLQGSGYLVNLSNHNLEWFEAIDLFRSADGKWDEPPSYPGLTNAYFQVIELAKDSVKKPFDKK